MRGQIPEDVFLPGEFRMLFQVYGRFEVDSTGMAHGGGKRTIRNHRSVRRLVLHRSGDAKFGLPRF